jgi:hypothetical protein
MNGLKLFPVILSFLLLAAHFYRSNQVIPAALCIAILALLFLKESWVARLFQVALLAAALEWLRTLYVFAQMRIEYDQPWSRLALILGVVALLTALSALVFRANSLRVRYQLKTKS